MFSALDRWPDASPRDDGVVGRRRNIIHADRVGRDVEIIRPRRRQDAKAPADRKKAGRRPFVAFNFERFAAASKPREKLRPAHPGPADCHRLCGAERAPGYVRRCALVEPHGRRHVVHAWRGDQHQALGIRERCRTALRACGAPECTVATATMAITAATRRALEFMSLALPRRIRPGLGANIIWLELIVRAAKLASHRNLAVLDHVIAVVLREAPQHGLDAVARARALRHDRHALEHAHAALVEQAINQPLARQ